MVVRESAPSMTPSEKVMAILESQLVRQRLDRYIERQASVH